MFYNTLPRTNDLPGYLYVYFRKRDKAREGNKTNVKLFKIGRTVSSPFTRIRNQAKKNEEEYLTAAVYKTHYNKNFEYLVRNNNTHTQRTDVHSL